MGIRIDHIRSGSETIVYIAGRLSGHAVAQLKKACDPIKGPMMINLSSLLFADEEGINAIRTMADKGAQVCGASPFMALLLDDAQNKKSSEKNNAESKPI